MFARDFVHLHQPFEVVAPRFTGKGVRLEPIITSALAQLGAPSRVAVGGPSAGPPAVQCVQGPARVRAGTLIVPASWVFDPDPWGFGPLETDLTVAPIDAMRCVVSVEALVRRPAELRAGDPQHAVETLLRAFLQALAVELDRQA